MKRPLMPEETHQPGSVVERTGGMEIALSVVLPVYNAMPWLTICVRDMLKQQLDDEGALELVVAVDGCTDDSLQFLQELATALGSRRATVEECPPPLAAGQGLAAPDRAKEDDRSAPQSDGLPASSIASLNPALAQPLRAPATSDHPSFAAGHVASGAAAVSTSGAGSHAKNTPPQPLSGADLAEPGPSPEPLTAGAVAAACRSEHRLLVLFYRTNCGQGAAMSLALSRCRSPLIAQVPSPPPTPEPPLLPLPAGTPDMKGPAPTSLGSRPPVRGPPSRPFHCSPSITGCHSVPGGWLGAGPVATRSRPRPEGRGSSNEFLFLLAPISTL